MKSLCVAIGWGLVGCGAATFYEEAPSEESPRDWVEGPANVVRPVYAFEEDMCPAAIARTRAEVLVALENSLANRRNTQARCLGRQAKLLLTLQTAALGGSFEGQTAEGEAVNMRLAEKGCVVALEQVSARARACE